MGCVCVCVCVCGCVCVWVCVCVGGECVVCVWDEQVCGWCVCGGGEWVFGKNELSTLSVMMTALVLALYPCLSYLTTR